MSPIRLYLDEDSRSNTISLKSCNTLRPPLAPPLHCGGDKNTVAFFFKIGIKNYCKLYKVVV